jgi:lipoate-protein ligase A
MALDEALLDGSAAGEGVTLRLYAWEQPTLSLGYFQPLAQRRRHVASANCPVVRRPSGGAAIVHDAELTYSLILPAGHSLTASARSLYREVHAALVGALESSGVPACMARAAAMPGGTSQPFLCFQRIGAGDVMLGSAKIAGSAQRRRRGAVMQHGSLLWRRSPAAPELRGVEELVQRPLDHAQLMHAWVTGLQTRLGISFAPGAPSAACLQRAERLCREKYEGNAWTGRR